MILRMLSDITKWAAVSAIILGAFSSLFYVLSPDCDPVRLPIRLVSGMLEGGFPDVCLEGEDEALGTVLQLLFSLTSFVLMFNLLIAILSKTFDSISDSSLINYQLLRAQLTINWKDMPAAPPPLRALRVPYEFYEAVFAVAREEDDAHDGATGLLTLPDGDFRHAAENIKVSVRDYYQSKADDATAGDRWRVALNKSITQKLIHTSNRLEACIKRELKAAAHGGEGPESKEGPADDHQTSPSGAGSQPPKPPMPRKLAAEVIQQAFRVWQARSQAVRARDAAQAMRLMAMMRDGEVAAAKHTLSQMSTPARRKEMALVERHEMESRPPEARPPEARPPEALARAEARARTDGMSEEAQGEEVHGQARAQPGAHPAAAHPAAAHPAPVALPTSLATSCLALPGLSVPAELEAPSGSAQADALGSCSRLDDSTSAADGRRAAPAALRDAPTLPTSPSRSELLRNLGRELGREIDVLQGGRIVGQPGVAPSTLLRAESQLASLPGPDGLPIME